MQLLNGNAIFANKYESVLTWILAKLLLNSSIDLIKESLVSSLFIIPELFLIMSLITILENNVSVKLEMENHLLNHIIGFEQAILIREFSEIVRSLWIIGNKSLNDLFFLLFVRQLLLIDTTQLIILIHVEEISIIL